MTLRHNNTSQIPEATTFNPLLQDENPYYKNLNRAPKNAYDYADSLNKMLSYGGCVSRLSPIGSGSYNLYDIVAILDGEYIDSANTMQTTNRYGIVVTEADSENYYIICTFCPNFVYPAEIVSSVANFDNTHLGKFLYLDLTTNSASHHWLAVNSTNTAPSLPASPVVLGQVTGAYSMFFHGTVRTF